MAVDPVMPAYLMLGVGGAAIGNTVRVKLSSDYTAPPIIWPALINRSGERKTPLFNLVMQPVFQHQSELAEEYAQVIAQYESDLLKWRNLPKRIVVMNPYNRGSFRTFI